jgi:glutathione gamma-glutamylcysteinyltransferase
MSLANAPSSLFRRALPASCIALNSRRGRRLIMEALATHGRLYFPMASHTTTQAEPAYCGLSALCAALNALKSRWMGG